MSEMNDPNDEYKYKYDQMKNKKSKEKRCKLEEEGDQKGMPLN